MQQCWKNGPDLPDLTDRPTFKHFPPLIDINVTKNDLKKKKEILKYFKNNSNESNELISSIELEIERINFLIKEYDKYLKEQLEYNALISDLKKGKKVSRERILKYL